MEPFGTGASFMVNQHHRIFFLFLFLIANSSYAGIQVSAFKHSWQENVSVLNNGTERAYLATLGGLSAELGYQFTFKKRYRYTPSVSYINGTTDLHKLTDFSYPRKNFTSFRLNNQFHYRNSKVVSSGLILAVNSTDVKEIGTFVSTGLFASIDSEIFDSVYLTFAAGSVSDSKQLGYYFGLKREF
jgi:hypothetical protein